MDSKKSKTLIQCDFDGTITLEDVSYFILDRFASKDWRSLLAQYEAGTISVGEFNSRVFSTVKADKQAILAGVFNEVKIREGFTEFVDYCNKAGYRLVIVSNGLDFYIEAVMNYLGIANIEIKAAQTKFKPEGIDARYISPTGTILQDGLKEYYVKQFQDEGYRVIYIGNGTSDIVAAQLADRVFATDSLLVHIRSHKLECTPFDTFRDIIVSLEQIK